jgi:phosphohistidine swiveling domain-containing protein
MNAHVVELSSRSANDRKLVGGKAANLHRLIQAGFNVPSGIVITTKAFDLFAKVNNLRPLIRTSLEWIVGGDQYSATSASREIQNSIRGGVVPDVVLSQLSAYIYGSGSWAVRSSASFEDAGVRSWAGQFDSYLRVNGLEIADHVLRCWASFFSTRALLYRPSAYKRLSLSSFAVIVQRMVEAERAGVAFSVDPVRKDNTKIVIEAATGLGDSVVAGERLPFTAVIDKKSGVVLRRVAPTERRANLLSLQELRHFWLDVRAIEKRVRGPVDVEWCIAGGKIYYLQARPITALRRQRPRAKLGAPDIRDYELTFKVAGLSFLFTDMLADGFGYMEPLFTSMRSEFVQYFSNDRMEFAAKEGVSWLSKPRGFDKYRATFTRYFERNRPILESIVSEPGLTVTRLRRFFRILSKLFTFYSKMDFPFTNLTYVYAAEHVMIRKNLGQLARFKDIARAWINATAIENDSPFTGLVRRLTFECGVPAVDLEYYKMTELAHLLLGGRRLSPRELRSRREAFAIYVSAGRKKYMTGSSAAAFAATIAAIDRVSASSEIVGQVANRTVDIVDGFVKVLNVDYGDLVAMNREISNMRVGEILVADFTAPELMEACQKAKAIVTDLGGMLSHAAIVSRELGIPCLVGTRYATKALRTGDRIRIDFRSGAITRVEASKPSVDVASHKGNA